MKTALVLGAGGFIGSHLVTRLKSEGYWVRGVDIKYPDFSDSTADDFVVADLRDPLKTSVVMYAPDQKPFDEVYQLAADMGGAGYINTGDHDADVVHNSMLINLNVLNEAQKKNVKKIFMHFDLDTTVMLCIIHEQQSFRLWRRLNYTSIYNILSRRPYVPKDIDIQDYLVIQMCLIV